MNIAALIEAVAPHLPADVIRSGDPMAIHAALHGMPRAQRDAVAAALPPAEGALLSAVARMPPADVAMAASAMPGLVQPVGALVSQQQHQVQALGAAHRLLTSMPAEAQEALTAQLPLAAQPLVGLASDLEPEEFAEVAQPLIAAISADANNDSVVLTRQDDGDLYEAGGPHGIEERAWEHDYVAPYAATAPVAQGEPVAVVPSPAAVVLPHTAVAGAPVVYGSPVHEHAAAPPLPRPPSLLPESPLSVAAGLRAVQTLVRSQWRLQRRFVLAAGPRHPRVCGLLGASVAAAISAPARCVDSRPIFGTT